MNRLAYLGSKNAGRRSFKILSQGLVICAALISLSSCQAQGPVTQGSFRAETVQDLQYFLYSPADARQRPRGSYGLLLFLHGGGESGGDLEALKRHGPPRLMAEGMQFPYFVLAPQNPGEKKWWDVRAVLALLDEIVREHGVDPDRIYLTGLSRGGSASWELLTQFPERFAAAAIICGIAPEPYAQWIDKKMGLRVYHGVEDPVIRVEQSDRMVARLRELGYEVEYTRYDGVGHNAWDYAYVSPGFFEWFTAYRRTP